MQENNYPNNYLKQKSLECSISGVCSINTALTSVHETILLHIKYLAFYLLKLKDFGITNDKIKKDVLNILYGIAINATYSQEEFQGIVKNIDEYITQSKYLYEKHCKENQLKIETQKIKLQKNYDLIDTIKKWEKNFIKKYKTQSEEDKNSVEIIHILGRSLVIKIVELQRLNGDLKDAYYTILSLINTIEESNFKFPYDFFEKGLLTFLEINKKIYAIQRKLFGRVMENEADMSSFEGKAILVSGTDLMPLKILLDETEKKDINIYTHGFDMLVAHTLPEFCKYKNLRGNFASGYENYIADFSVFPGPIVMSRVYMENVDFLYRGRLFSPDPYVSKGITRIDDFEFAPVVNSAIKSVGFKKNHKRKKIKLGYNEEEVTAYTDKILQKVKDGKIKNLYIIGLCNFSDKSEDYYEEFLQKLPDNSFAFSFSHPKSAENIFHINSYFDTRLFLKIFRNFKDIPQGNISIFVTKGDRYVVTNLLLMKKLGFRHVFSSNFPDSIIAPNVKDILQQKFKINFISNVDKDIEKTMY